MTKRKGVKSDLVAITVEFHPADITYMKGKAELIGIRALTEYIRLKCLEDRELESATNKLISWLKKKPGVEN